MFNNYTFTTADRLMRYVQIDTQADPHSNTHPTSTKQKDLSKLLVKELLDMGIADAETDEFGYVYATIPATSKKNLPTICFCSHVDTAPDCSGTGVKPILHKNYDGTDIVLPDDHTQVLSTSRFPYLKQHIGNDIITASGRTLLGADDKAGVSIIMDMANFLLQHPEIMHGPIRILFTPDEEVGKGTVKLDMVKLGAQYGYTLDGGEVGTMEDETFSADGVTITIKGVSAHPGDAKGKMVNALKIAGEILAALPKDNFSPESTSGRQGFIHPTQTEGVLEQVELQFIIRDFLTEGLEKLESMLEDIVKTVIANYSGATYQFTVKEQYRNMKEILDTCPFVVEYAKQAIRKIGYEPVVEPIRGGTDGSRLSFMGLPCPNIFTGMQNIHGKLEWIGVRDMNLAVQTLVHLCMIWEQHNTEKL